MAGESRVDALVPGCKGKLPPALRPQWTKWKDPFCLSKKEQEILLKITIEFIEKVSTRIDVLWPDGIWREGTGELRDQSSSELWFESSSPSGGTSFCGTASNFNRPIVAPRRLKMPLSEMVLHRWKFSNKVDALVWWFVDQEENWVGRNIGATRKRNVRRWPWEMQSQPTNGYMEYCWSTGTICHVDMNLVHVKFNIGPRESITICYSFPT